MIGAETAAIFLHYSNNGQGITDLDGELIDYSGRDFREFMAKGFDGHHATLADFELQLSTLFPEARLKRVIEVRGADAGGPDMLCALPALWKGILYDAAARKSAWALCDGWTQKDREKMWDDVSRTALDAKVGGTSMLELAQELFRIAEGGLQRQAKLSKKGNDETFYLKKMKWLLFDAKKSPGKILLEQWNGEFAGDIEKYLAATKY